MKNLSLPPAITQITSIKSNDYFFDSPLILISSVVRRNRKDNPIGVPRLQDDPKSTPRESIILLFSLDTIVVKWDLLARHQDTLGKNPASSRETLHAGSPAQLQAKCRQQCSSMTG